jgi:hypothetical protein
VTSCNVGFANCNGTVNDGCETSTSNDTSNCGACGTVCAVGQSCVNGHCQ